MKTQSKAYNFINIEIKKNNLLSLIIIITRRSGGHKNNFIYKKRDLNLVITQSDIKPQGKQRVYEKSLYQMIYLLIFCFKF